MSETIWLTQILVSSLTEAFFRTDQPKTTDTDVKRSYCSHLTQITRKILTNWVINIKKKQKHSSTCRYYLLRLITLNKSRLLTTYLASFTNATKLGKHASSSTSLLWLFIIIVIVRRTTANTYQIINTSMTLLNRLHTVQCKSQPCLTTISDFNSTTRQSEVSKHLKPS